MKLKYCFIFLILVSFQSLADTATNLAKGKKIGLGTCVACHGVAGISPNDLWPNIAGQKKGYLVKQLQDFKAGRRNDPLMGPQSMLLSDEDIEAVSLYFSQLKPE